MVPATFVRPRAAVIALPSYVPGRRADSSATAALASNENHHDPLPSVVAAVASAGARMNRYPESTALDLRERIAHEFQVTADEVAVGPGSVGVLQQIISSFCDPGDEVVFAWRSFEAYPLLVSLASAVPVPIALRPDEHHDLDAMAAAITDRTRVILLCTPNNPTGVSIRHTDLVAFLEQVPPHVLVVVDEAYLEYDQAAGSVNTMAAYRDFSNMCALRTFSKAHGLAGLRIGYAITRPELAEALRRTALPFGVTNLAQAAAVASLDAPQELAERVGGAVAERARLTHLLRSNGWDVPDSNANFVWLRLDDHERTAVLNALDGADIIARGYAADGVRISVADSTATDRVATALGVRGERRAF